MFGDYSVGDDVPMVRSTALAVHFLHQCMLDPRVTGYTVTNSVVAQVYRSLWSSIFSQVTPARLLPREVAPTTVKALAFLEQCNWNLCVAQKQAAIELRERKREQLGGVASAVGSSPSSSVFAFLPSTPTSVSSSTTSPAKGKFVTPRSATPPPGYMHEEMLGGEYGEDRKGVACGHVFRKGEAIYRCRDCALDDTCVLCAPCFNASNHEGHDIVFSVSSASGGCCDCGDEEAWVRRIRCKYHDANDGNRLAASGSGMEGNTADRDDSMDQDLDQRPVHSSFDAKGKGPERSSSSPDHTAQVESLLQGVPADERDAILSQVVSLTRFVLEMLEHAPDDMKLPEGPDAIEVIKRQATLEPAIQEEDEMALYNPTAGAYSFDSVQHKRMYSVILWNDEKHSFREVIDIVREATGKSESEAKAVAERIDRHGREIIETASDVRRLYLLAHKLGQIDLAVTIRPAYDVFAEEIAGHVIAFLLDLANASFYVTSSTAPQDAVHPLDQLTPSTVTMRALIGRALLDPWRPSNPIAQGQMSSAYFDPGNLTQIDGLLLMDHKLWKGARANAKSLYLALIGPRDIKRAFAQRFAFMFAKLVEIFILHDREPEHSIRFIAVQLFSVPSIATELVATTGFLQKLFVILQAIFTSPMASGALALPPKAAQRMQVSPSSMLLRQQRCHHILYDLRYLLGAVGVQREIVTNVAHLYDFLDFLSIFNAVTPDRRAVSEHIEFESEIWVPIFHVATHVARTAKLFGEAYTKADEDELSKAIGITMASAHSACLQLHKNDPEIYEEVKVDTVTVGPKTYRIIDFAVESQPVSFHHPLHWLLAEMLKSVGKIESQQQLLSITRHIGEDEVLFVFDFPLRVVVKLAQIRASMWVRNGFGIRSQAHHYRDNSMRDVMYDQDLYLIQCALVFIDPDRMLVNIAHRFSSMEWLRDGTVPEHIEEDQMLCLAEELVLFLVTLLSETCMATNRDMDRQVRREIVHFLALNQGTYSELTRHMSDKMKDFANFDRILTSVSKYRAPDGTNDLGIFELKDECYDEVLPFFFHYSRNQREKVEQVLKDRQKRKTNGASSTVTLPKPVLSAGGNAFIDTLKRTFASPILIVIVYGCLRNASRQPDDIPDGLIDGALQLLMMGLVEMPGTFARSISTTVPTISEYEHEDAEKSTILHVLLQMRTENKLNAFKPKVEWVLETSCRQDPGNCNPIVERLWKSHVPAEVSLQASADERRKAAAKARQAAIMQQFSAQQKSLLDSLEDDIMGDDEEEMDMAVLDSDGTEVKHKVIGSCIFCQEELKPSQAFGSLAHIQNSRLVRTTPRHDPSSLQQCLQTPLTLDRDGSDGKRERGYMPNNVGSINVGPTDRSNRHWSGFSAEDRRFGFYASTCGHLMHLQCFDVYCRSTEQRHTQQIARNHPEDPSRSEFVCPLCKSLGNVILPVPTAVPARKQAEQEPLSISDWIRRINIEILKTSASSLRADLQETEHGTGCFVPWFAEDSQGVLEAWLARESAAGSPSEGLANVNRQILERLCRVLRPYSTKSRGLRSTHQSRTIVAPPSRKMYIPEEVVAYTLSVLEIAQRGQKPAGAASNDGTANVSDSMSEQTMDLIVSLITCLRDIARVEEPNYQVIMKHGLLMRLLPHWGGHDTVRSPLLLRDPTTILVEAAAIIPESLGYMTILMFYVTLIQVVFGVAQPSLWPQNGAGGAGRGLAGFRGTMAEEVNHAFAQSDSQTLSEVFDDVRGTVANIIGLVGYARGNITLGVDNLDDVGLAKMICTYCLPFLRRATIIQRCMGVLPSSVNGVHESGALPTLNGEASEFTRLMRLLSIPMPREALSSTATRQSALAGLVEGWIKHAYPQLASIFRPLPIQPSPLSASSTKQSGHHHPMLQLEHPHIYELIRLPSNLTTLLMQSQVVKCKRCGNSPAEPAICLECGEMLCFQSFCCQNSLDGHGECNRHLEECGHATGLFFKIKSNIIVLLFQGKGTFTFSPYLDAHGEIDIGLKKGKIQFLHQVRFDELRKQWLQHGLANIITRKTEAVMDQGGWTTM